MEHKYWDEGNGCVTDDKSCALIYDGGNFYIETYDVYDRDRISIMYSEEQKKNENMYYFRKAVCEQDGIELNELGKLVRFGVPTEVYKKIMQECE